MTANHQGLRSLLFKRISRLQHHLRPEAGGLLAPSIPSAQTSPPEFRSGVLFNGSRRWWPLAVVLGVTLSGVSCLPQVSPVSKARGTVQPELKLLQRAGRLDVIVSGAGSGARVHRQRQQASSWQGVLILGEGAGAVGSAQKLSMQSLGLAMVQLRSEGSATTLQVEAVSGQALSTPEIRASGDDLIISFARLSPLRPGQSSGLLDLTRPGRIAQPGFVPPVRPQWGVSRKIRNWRSVIPV